jgi:hypothetical protein
MNNHHPARRHARIGAALAGSAIAAAVTLTQSQSGTHAAPPTPSTICTLQPAPDLMPVEPGILGTVIARQGEIAVLHRISCNGHTMGWRWLTSNDILTGEPLERGT